MNRILIAIVFFLSLVWHPALGAEQEDPNIVLLIQRFDQFAEVDITVKPYRISWISAVSKEDRARFEEFLNNLTFANHKPRKLYQNYLFCAKHGELAIKSKSLWIRKGHVKLGVKDVPMKKLRDELRKNSKLKPENKKQSEKEAKN